MTTHEPVQPDTPGQAISDAPPMVRAGQAWWLVVLLGVVTLAAGVAVLTRPAAGALALAVLFGAWLLVTGGVHVLAAVFGAGHGTGWRVLIGVLGALLAVGGAVLLVSPLRSLATLVLFVGLSFIVEGITDVVVAVTDRDARNRLLLGVLGVIAVIAGALVIANPALGLATVVALAGFWLIVSGVLRIAYGFTLRAA
jgi:uncharacterized membrane protein HdeD (DUF308 family)